jgi:hypothetical protein
VRQRLISAAVLAALVIISASCVSDPSAAYFPASQPGANHPAPGPNPSAAKGDVSATTVLVPHGPLARPDPNLTPGAVATTDLATVCHQSKRARGVYGQKNALISPGDQQAILDAYKIPAPQAKHYGFDFLVPLQLGGANARPNIWPVSMTHGVGFREKYVLNVRMHVLVCHGEMPLDQAQRAMANDWIKLWMRYGS